MHLFDPIVDDYDNSWLVKLAQEQYPELPKLAEGLSKCKIAKTPHCTIDLDNTYYLTFFNLTEKNVRIKESNIILYNNAGATIVLDVYNDFQIYGIEFLHDIDLRKMRMISVEVG